VGFPDREVPLEKHPSGRLTSPNAITQARWKRFRLGGGVAVAVGVRGPPLTHYGTCIPGTSRKAVEMFVGFRWVRRAAAFAMALGLVAAVGGCTQEAVDVSGNGPVTVVLQYFGKPGFDKAIDDFRTAHPNIHVRVQNMGELKDFQPKLVQWLAAGKGAGDVVMLEEGTLLGFVQDSQNFTNLLDLGAGNLKDSYLPYKWQSALTAGGKLIGLGTDVGGLAMCYRSDLFAKAGLPTDRDAVSNLWKTWDDYVAVGQKFAAKVKDAAWLDSATSIMQPYIMQNSDTWFYSRDNRFIGDVNPIVRRAWDFGLKLASNGLTAKLVRWDPDWVAAFKNAAFATVPCPAWYTGVIESNTGEAGKGKWDIATIPGGSGNWGGSYLAIPKQSHKKQQAFELVKYLTGVEGEISEYKAVGAMPSNTKALDDPRFRDSTNAYFRDAPTGVIFGNSAKALKPIYLGPMHQQIWENVVEPEMQAAERGKLSSAAAWKKAMKDAHALADG
jgi:cellobiose transport system substrate-binding protein